MHVKNAGRRHKKISSRGLASITASALVAGTLATVGALIGASPAAAQDGCTFNGTPAGGVVPGTVVPGTTTIAVACTGLPAGIYAVADSSPLAGVLTNPTVTNELNLTLGFKTVTVGTSGSLSTTFTIPSATTAPNTDGTCPPSKAQVDVGLTNCSVAVANDVTGVVAGDAALIYPGQPTPDATTLNLTPASGPSGTTVTVSGSNWWGNAIANVAIPSSSITVGGVAATTSSVSVPPATYAPGTGINGSGGTLKGGTITGTFNIPSTAPAGTNSVTITEPNSIPAGDPPYSGATISGTSTFAVVAGAPAPPVITTKKLGGCHIGKPYAAALAATGGTPPYTWTLTAGSLPPDLTLSTDGVISGTDSTQKGKFTFTVTVTDSASGVASAMLSIRCSGHV